MIGFLIYVYFVIVIVTEFSVFGTQNFFLILSAFLAPLMAWLAGSRIRVCFYADRKGKIFDITISLAFLLIAYYWIYLTEVSVILFSIKISGTIWITKGLLLGFIFSKKEVHAGKGSLDLEKGRNLS
jgi:hypothetical protein|tara:strand:+ start:66 stop:446 length:381 start_codon:yes stop_codon:yes gene_type:complete